MSLIIEPRHVKVYYDNEDAFGDGGSGGTQTWEWIGMIQEAPSLASYSKMSARGLGSVDVQAIRTGMKANELNLKWIVQRARAIAVAFDPLTFLAYAHTFPTYGLGLEVLYTYGATPSYVSLWYKGGLINKLTMEWTIDSYITASAQIFAQDMVTAVSPEGATNPTGYRSNPIDLTNSYALPLTGHDSEVFLDVDAGGDTSTEVRSVRFTIDNKLRRLPVIQAANSELLKYMARGARTLSGEIGIYFANRTAFDYVLGNNALDITFHLQKTDNAPSFDFTGCKIDNALINTRITEFPCTVNLPFTAAALAIT